MRNIITSIATAAALIAAPAFAETKPGTAAPTAASAEGQAAPRDKRYCVDSRGIGSRLAKRVCKTRADWIRDEGFDPLTPDQ